MACRDLSVLDDILCERFERTVRKDNCVHFEGRVLQIPADRHRCHYVKARVRVLRYTDGSLSIHHGSRELARYDAQGQEIPTELYRLQHNVRGSAGSWEVPPGAFQRSNQKRTIYVLQNRTVLFVANKYGIAMRE